MKNHRLVRLAMATSIVVGSTVLALASVAVLIPSAQAQQNNTNQAAEIAFWDSVKDTKNPAELQAYIDRYPNGTFTGLARVRLETLRKTATNPAPTPTPTTQPTTAGTLPPAPGPNSVLTAAATVREVQTILYNLNYRVGPDTTALTGEMREAIRAWERNTKQTETGDVTQEQLERLRGARIPSVWGAISYSWTGATGAVWNRPDRKSAETDARKICDEAAGRDCSFVATFGNACGVVAHASPEPGKNGYATGYTRTLMADAEKAALNDCRTRAESPNNCVVRNTFCADGSHQKQ